MQNNTATYAQQISLFGGDESTSSQVDFLANRSPSPGNAKAQTMNATSGRQCLRQFGQSVPDGSLYETIRMSLQSKIDYSVELLRKAEPLALKMHPDGFHLAFSGGKDSQVLYHLAQMAGVKFKAHMQITTLDPPELMRFVRTQYPDVELHRPEINFYKLIIKKKMLPLMNARYCCQVLKEHAGVGTTTLIGVRAAESTKRANRAEVEKVHKTKSKRRRFDVNSDIFNIESETHHRCIGGKDKIVISPIFHWQDADVWNFLRGNGIEYCRLYNEGYHRIGCMFCPMTSPKSKALDRQRYPGVERAIKRSIQELIDNENYGHDYNATADEMFDWWVSNESAKTYFGMLRNQTKIQF